MAINDIYQVVLSGTYLSESWSNVFWFIQQSGPSSLAAANLADSFEFQDLPNIADFMNDSVGIDSLSVINYNDPLDSVLVAPTITDGARTGTSDPAPSFLSGTIRFTRNGPGTRYPYKRFVGLLEEDINGNNLEVATIALLTTIASDLLLNHIFGAYSWRYCQIGGTPSLGTNPTLNFIVGGLSAVRLGTQNTRKGA